MRLILVLFLSLLSMIPARADTREDALLLDVQPVITRNAPSVDRVTLTSIIAIESSGWPWTVRDNSTTEPPMYLPSYEDATRVATRLAAIGHNLDLGPAQINTSNLESLHLSVEQVLVPDNNIAAAQTILEWARDTVIKQKGRAWVQQEPLEAAQEITQSQSRGLTHAEAMRIVIQRHGLDWVHQHPADAARIEVQLYHANQASPTYLAAIMKIAPHVASLLYEGARQ